MANAIQLKNPLTEEALFPYTKEELITDNDGVSLGSKVSHLRNMKWENQSVTGTPTAVSSYAPWDTKQEYGYYLDLNLTGLEESMAVTNIAVDDVTQELVGFNVDILNGKVRFYLKEATEVTLTIIEMNAGTHQAIPDISSVYPIGSVYLSVNNTNPSTLFGGTWELIGEKLAVRENVFGNGKALGFSNGTDKFAIKKDDYNASYGLVSPVTSGYGLDVGENGSGKPSSYGVAGIVTKEQLGDNPENSGLIVDTETIYSWKRVA